MAEEHLPSKFTFILHADVAGSTALVQQDEHLAHQRIRDTFRRFIDTITKYQGHVRELRGDALLAEFDRASAAVTAALAFQAEQAEHNTQLSDNIQPTLRVGIAMGEVIIADDTLTGAGVVLAQRMEQLAEPGGVCITGAIQEALPQRLPFDQESLGEQRLKGFDEPVRVYSVQLKSGVALPKPIGGAKTKIALVIRSAMIATAVVLICGGGLLAWYQPWAPDFEPVSPATMARPLPAKPSIAVLPFDDLSTGENQDYLSDAISEGIITELSQFSELFVIARNSSFQYRDQATDVRDIAAELGVHYVLEGSQQKDGDRLRVTVQLIDALAGNHIWAERYDRSLEDLFIVQDEIVRSVASTAGAKIAFRPPPTGGMDRLSAFHHHLKARQYIRQFTREGTEQARLENLAAIEADPTSPFGYIGLTFVYLRGYLWGWTDLEAEEALARAQQSAEKALELDPNNYDSHYARGYVHVESGEQDLAIARFEKSIELNPSATDVMAALSEPLVYSGRFDDAIERLHRAMRLDPHHPDWFKWGLAWAQWHASDCAGALSTLLGMAKIPNPARRTLAAIYVCLDRQQEAEATIADFLEDEPDYSIAKVKETAERKYKDPAELERWLNAMRTAGLPENPPLELPDKPSIAVMPFTNMSDDTQQEYFVDGMTEDLITDLSKLNGLFVIARNSTFTYKGKPVKVRQVAQELGVRYVLEGSVRRAGDQVRVNAQLIDATTGGHVWAERYDGSTADVFALQDKVTRQIVAALAVSLTADEDARQAHKQTDSPQAYDAFLQGWSHYRRYTSKDFARALDYFKAAVELDPNYARAHAAIAGTYTFATIRGWTFYLGWCRAQFLAEAHLQLAMKAPTALAHRVSSALRTQQGRHAEAVAEAEQTIVLHPNDTENYDALGYALIWAGRPEEAIEMYEHAMRLDPHYPAQYLERLGLAYFSTGQYEVAADNLERARTRNAGLAAWTLTAAYGYLGREQEAAALLVQYLQQRGLSQLPSVDTVVGYHPYARRADAERLGTGLIKAGLCCEDSLDSYVVTMQGGSTLFTRPVPMAKGFEKPVDATVLNEGEIHDKVVGNTVAEVLGGTRWSEYYLPDGTLSGIWGDQHYCGYWATSGPVMCIGYGGVGDFCSMFSLEGTTITRVKLDGTPGSTGELFQGNPESL